MRLFLTLFPATLLIFAFAEMKAIADEPASTQVVHIEPFTGKVARKNVRLRVSPSVDAPIVRELHAGELLIVDDRKEGFYRVRPSNDMKAYVFRSFILDGEVEGAHVNVRLSPELDSPVIAQLNTGDHVAGTISSQNNKWLEIAPPQEVRFWVAEEFVEKAGDEHYLALVENRRSQATRLLSLAMARGAEELNNGFEEIQIQPVLTLYQQVIDQYSEFEELAAKAASMSKKLSDDYLKVKIAYLETKAAEADRLAATQQWWAAQNETFASAAAPAPKEEPVLLVPGRLTFWKQVEQQYIDRWLATTHESDPDLFYRVQKEKGSTLHGIIEPYLRPVRNKPGDYLLLNPDDSKPIAYLYSTEVNLQQSLGKELDLLVVERPNNHFAYPAYYVLDVKTAP